MSTLTSIVDTLKTASIDAYLPGRHDGKCLSAYAVAADGGVIRTGKTTGRHVYLVTVCVPMDQPSALNARVTAVRTALAGMTALRQTGDQSADRFDEEIEAYCVTLEYSALCSV